MSCALNRVAGCAIACACLSCCSAQNGARYLETHPCIGDASVPHLEDAFVPHLGDAFVPYMMCVPPPLPCSLPFPCLLVRAHSHSLFAAFSLSSLTYFPGKNVKADAPLCPVESRTRGCSNHLFCKASL
eukprot:5700553-Pleurochrysis_carterae.AAC.2